MGKGKRYNGEQKLNMKKVFAVIIALVVIIMFVIAIVEMLKQTPDTKEKTFAIAYYTIYQDEKWGVIDTNGNIVLEPKYDEMIVIPDNTKQIFITTQSVNYNDGTYVSKAINQNGEQLYTTYDSAEAVINHDQNNNLWYEENILKVRKDGKYGLINMEGTEILPCEYDDIQAVAGVTKSLITSKDGNVGLVDNTGKIIIENTYKTITALTTQYENGYIVENGEGEKGVINLDKTIAVEVAYEDIANIYGNNMYVVKENGVWEVINKDKEVFLAGKYDEITAINGNYITVKKDNKYAVVNKEGTEQLPFDYDDIKYAYSNYFIAKKDNKYGIIDTDLNTKIDFKYISIIYEEEADFIRAQLDDLSTEILDRDFSVKISGIVSEINTSKNYIRVRVGDDYKYYNFKLEEKANTEILSTNTIFLSKKDGKYGYVNSKGVVVVDYIYDDATEQNRYGYVSVKKDGKWGCLDQKGKVVVEPSYELQNNLVIDFISSWHLAEDINANYYIK